MNALERVRAASPALKVFPLPSAVLLPGTAMPLHIFEPRYRALVEDALSGDRVLALAQLEPGWEDNYQGRPRLRPMCCAGLLIWSEKLPDGRYNIILQGIARARVLEEPLTDKSYREVRAHILEDAPSDHGIEEELLRQAVLELSVRVPHQVAEDLVQVAARTSGGALADVVAGSIIADVERRQELLCELDTRARLRAVLDDVGDLIGRLGSPRPAGPAN